MIIRILFLFIFILSNVYAAPKKILAATYKNKVVKRPIIVLDAGHGGLDRGAKIKYPYVEEKKVCLATVLYTKRYLEQMGYKVILTRSKDYFVPLKKRVEMANESQAELFVSIHFNSCPNKVAHGIEIYYFNSKENKKRADNSRNLAQSILPHIVKNTNAKSRGVKRADFCVVRDTNMPSILIEAGFLTNPQERDNIRKKSYLEKVSLGIAQGIENFIKSFV